MCEWVSVCEWVSAFVRVRVCVCVSVCVCVCVCVCVSGYIYACKSYVMTALRLVLFAGINFSDLRK